MATLTSTTPTPCTCCGTCVTAVLECRIRGGVASLIGYDEVCGPSSPPKRYRTATYSGVNLLEQYSNDTCTSLVTASASITWSGARSYTAAGVFTDTSREVHRSPIGGGIVIDTTPVMPFSTPDACVDGVGCESNGLVTPVSFTLSANNACCFVAGNYRKASGSRTFTLSDEDTEDDAITRLLDAAMWSSWSSASLDTSCLAAYEQRTSGFNIAYYEAEWRVVVAGLTPSTTYWVRITYFRRSYGVGSYALFAYEIKSGVSDGAGNLTISGTVANEQGFETYASAGELCAANPGDLP